MNEKYAIAILFFILAASTWMWEYSKFVNKHGIFYYISHGYGVYILTISVLVILGLALKRALGGKDHDQLMFVKVQSFGEVERQRVHGARMKGRFSDRGMAADQPCKDSQEGGMGCLRLSLPQLRVPLVPGLVPAGSLLYLLPSGGRNASRPGRTLLQLGV